jgi:hypothetical protein
MDLQLISDSIQALKTTRDLIEKNAQLETQLKNLTRDFQDYKLKVKVSIQEYCKNTQYQINLLNRRIQELEMVIFM